MNGILVVIPAYNVAGTLAELVGRIRLHRQPVDMLVIDDGSSDGTPVVAREAGSMTISHPTNRGKGAALRTGFEYAVRHDYDAVITLDGDLQHDPAEIDRFIAAWSGNDTLLVGARALNRSMPLPRRISNSLSSFLTSVFCATRIVDSQSGYRLIPVTLLRRAAFVSSQFELEAEVLIKAAKLGFRIEFLPVRTIYHSGKSWINPFSDTIRFLKMLLQSLFW
jgi:glycosyltransferase involved in cell wall biosynthesis